MFATRPTLVFTSGVTWFQLLVKVATLARVDHVAIGLGDHLLHARDTGVTLEPRSRWFADNRQTFVAEYEILPDVSTGLAECLRRVGEPYDKLGVARTFLGLIWQRGLSATMLDLQSAARAHTCAGFVTKLNSDNVIPEWCGLSSGSVVPIDLFRAIEGPSFRRIVQPLYQL